MKRSAGIVAYVEQPGEVRKYLIMRCYKNWDFPKGEFDPVREQPIVAALREFHEETGISVLDPTFDLQIKLVDMRSMKPWSVDTEPYGKGKTQKVATFFLAKFPVEFMGKVNPPISPELGKAEHEEVRWATFNEALELLHPRLQAVLTSAAAVIMAPLDPVVVALTEAERKKMDTLLFDSPEPPEALKAAFRNRIVYGGLSAPTPDDVGKPVKE